MTPFGFAGGVIVRVMVVAEEFAVALGGSGAEKEYIDSGYMPYYFKYEKYSKMAVMGHLQSAATSLKQDTIGLSFQKSLY
jgi:hypothetical protein